MVSLALGLTQPLIDMSTKTISFWGGGERRQLVSRADNLTTLPPSCADYLEIWGASTSFTVTFIYPFMFLNGAHTVTILKQQGPKKNLNQNRDITTQSLNSSPVTVLIKMF
jgi:hypothetical protein